MQVSTLGAFFIASVLLGIAPGPDNLYVLNQAALYGARAGLRVTAGLCTGLLVHTCAVALGIAALVAASQSAFTAIKIVGALYLCYLAWGAFKASSSGADTLSAPRLSGWVLYRRGILMNVTNPKVTVFFVAFLPQFADPKAGALALQLMFLGLLFIVATVIVFGTISFLAARIGRRLMRSELARRWLNRATGTLFVLLAARLVVSKG